MKKYIKFVSVLLSLLMIFSALSCANDSVGDTEPETNTENPSDKPNKEGVNYDGTYPIELKLLYSKSGEFLQADLSKLLYLEDSLKLDLFGNCAITIAGVEKKYSFYQFDIPEKLKGYFTGDPKSEIPLEGIIVAEQNKVNAKDKLDLVISDKGKTVTTDWTKVTYIGTISDVKLKVLKYNLDFNSISLKDKNNKEYVYLSEPKKHAGTWEYKENDFLVKTIIINNDAKDNIATGSYNFSETDKGEIILDYKKIGRITVIKNSDKTTFGMLIPTKLGSIDFYPAGKLIPITFTKKGPLPIIPGTK